MNTKDRIEYYAQLFEASAIQPNEVIARLFELVLQLATQVEELERKVEQLEQQK